MGFFQKLFKPLSPSAEKRYYTFQVKCKRCGEIIEGRVNLDNDLSVEYEDGGDRYYCRKVVMGAGTCYQKIEVGLQFDSKRKLIESRVEGGDFVKE
ncbi:MAG: hypothetical protein CVU44_00280 [Chloroflexi bacterium HGW-Chloroflexi-6]|nr:MAG: hypothetical protein CVU44_00280 [Chloroflexi bacterium HGW-Chloroflexi-6]